MYQNILKQPPESEDPVKNQGKSKLWKPGPTQLKIWEDQSRDIWQGQHQKTNFFTFVKRKKCLGKLVEQWQSCKIRKLWKKVKNCKWAVRKEKDSTLGQLGIYAYGSDSYRQFFYGRSHPCKRIQTIPFWNIC